MKIVHKLSLLAGVSSILFLASYGISYQILIPLDTIAAEQHQLNLVESSCLEFQVGVNTLLDVAVGAESSQFLMLTSSFDAAFENLNSIKLLPQLDPTIAEAIQSISNLRELCASDISTMTDTLEEIRSKLSLPEKAGQRLFPFLLEHAGKDNPMVGYLFNQYDSSILGMNEILKTTIQVIRKQQLVIGTAVDRIHNTAMLAVAGFAVLILCLIFGLLMLISRSVSRSVRSLVKKVGIIASGDLSIRFSSKEKDEIGLLAGHLDSMLDAWTASVETIQALARDNAIVRDKLAGSVDSSTSSAVEIEANTGSIQGQMNRLDGMIRSSTDRLISVDDSLSRFQMQLTGQSERVYSTGDSAEQFLVALAKIVELTEEDRRAAEALTLEAGAGEEVLEASFEKVAEIAERIDEIQEMTQVITDISAQTQILALNAAIEAAHAGEFGKGFSVVADEITKLAAVSASSSNQIKQTIFQIVRTIPPSVNIEVT